MVNLTISDLRRWKSEAQPTVDTARCGPLREEMERCKQSMKLAALYDFNPAWDFSLGTFGEILMSNFGSDIRAANGFMHPCCRLERQVVEAGCRADCWGSLTSNHKRRTDRLKRNSGSYILCTLRTDCLVNLSLRHVLQMAPKDIRHLLLETDRLSEG